MSTRTQYRVVSHFPNGKQHVALSGTLEPGMTAESLEEMFSWLSTERDIGEFDRVEIRTVTTEYTQWTEFKDIE